MSRTRNKCLPGIAKLIKKSPVRQMMPGAIGATSAINPTIDPNSMSNVGSSIGGMIGGMPRGIQSRRAQAGFRKGKGGMY